MADQTREPQYQAHVALRDAQGLSRLGLRANAAWHADPKRLGIVLSRYKFVAKMLERQAARPRGRVRRRVGEPGRPAGGRVADRDRLRSGCSSRTRGRAMDAPWQFDAARPRHARRAGRGTAFDAAFALDVHRAHPGGDEDRFIANIAASLDSPGVAIFGHAVARVAAVCVAAQQGRPRQLQDRRRISRSSCFATSTTSSCSR